VPFPLSLRSSIRLPLDRGSDPAAVASRLAEALTQAGATNVRRDATRLTFASGGFDSAGRRRLLTPVSSGELRVSAGMDGVSVSYDLRFTRAAMGFAGATAVSFAVGVGVMKMSLLLLLVVWATAAWVLYFGVLYLPTALDFPLFLRDVRLA
jgi:hypothetical protein